MKRKEVRDLSLILMALGFVVFFYRVSQQFTGEVSITFMQILTLTYGTNDTLIYIGEFIFGLGFIGFIMSHYMK
jgi:hypothetical protein